MNEKGLGVYSPGPFFRFYRQDLRNQSGDRSRPSGVFAASWKEDVAKGQRRARFRLLGSRLGSRVNRFTETGYDYRLAIYLLPGTGSAIRHPQTNLRRPRGSSHATQDEQNKNRG